MPTLQKEASEKGKACLPTTAFQGRHFLGLGEYIFLTTKGTGFCLAQVDEGA